jgi:hypothetical protein
MMNEEDEDDRINVVIVTGREREREGAGERDLEEKGGMMNEEDEDDRINVVIVIGRGREREGAGERERERQGFLAYPFYWLNCMRSRPPIVRSWKFQLDIQYLHGALPDGNNAFTSTFHFFY